MFKVFLLLILFFLLISAVKVYGGEAGFNLSKKLSPYLALPAVPMWGSPSPTP